MVRAIPPHNLGALLGCSSGRQHHQQPRAVKQVAARHALRRVIRADQAELRWHTRANALALNSHFAAFERTEQQVGGTIGQQVESIDIDRAAVRAGEYAWPQHPRASAQRCLNIQAAKQRLLIGTKR